MSILVKLATRSGAQAALWKRTCSVYFAVASGMARIRTKTVTLWSFPRLAHGCWSTPGSHGPMAQRSANNTSGRLLATTQCLWAARARLAVTTCLHGAGSSDQNGTALATRLLLAMPSIATQRRQQPCGPCVSIGKGL